MHEAYIRVDAESPLLDVTESVPVKKIIYPFIKSTKYWNATQIQTISKEFLNILTFSALPVLHTKRFHKVSNN